MELITPELREKLIANGKTPDSDPVPPLKLFNPAGSGTWLVTELDPDDPSVGFGLADLGFGCPELGSFSLDELRSFQGRSASASSVISGSRAAGRSRSTPRPPGTPAASSNSVPSSTLPPDAGPAPSQPKPDYTPFRAPSRPRPGWGVFVSRRRRHPCPISRPRSQRRRPAHRRPCIPWTRDAARASRRCSVPCSAGSSTSSP